MYWEYIIMESRSNSLEFEIRQTKSLLNDFKKTKAKCLELSDKIGREINNLQQYEILSINCTRKLQSLNHEGVINLKNQLIKGNNIDKQGISQLYEVQRDLMYEIEKNSFKKSIKTPVVMSKQALNISSNMQELKQFQIPNYQSHIQSNDSKIERIANFVLSLSKSMVTLRKSVLGNWEEKQFYKYEPEYVEIMRRLEQFQMRDEELGQIIERRYQEQLHHIMNQAQKVEQNKDYFVLKISKMAIQNTGKSQSQSQIQNICPKTLDFKSHNNIDQIPKPIIRQSEIIVPFKKIPLKKIHEQKLTDIEKENQQQLKKNNLNQNLSCTIRPLMNQIDNRDSILESRPLQQEKKQEDNRLSIISEVTSQTNINASILQSISSLRQMRKKVFDDDIWDELQKI